MKNVTLGFLAVAIAVAIPVSVSALSGVNADEVVVKVYTKQGDEWFKGRTTKTNDKGYLTAKRALPGRYKIFVRDEDEASGQFLAAKFQLLDDDATRINHKTDVDAYMKIGGEDVLIATYETDDEGWVSLAGLTPGAEYKIDVKEGSNLDKKEGQVRIKCYAKIEGSDWFRTLYTRTENGVLEAKNVLSGWYKFKYKEADAPATQPFVLRARLLETDAEKIDEKTNVELFTKMNGIIVKVAEVQTTEDGWITVPGVMTWTEYKVQVAE